MSEQTTIYICTECITQLVSEITEEDDEGRLVKFVCPRCNVVRAWIMESKSQ